MHFFSRNKNQKFIKSDKGADSSADSLTDQTYFRLVSLLMHTQLAIIQFADLHGLSAGQIF